jgi:selenide, water dikinase
MNTENIEPIKLTQFSKGAGCGCKIAPNVLQEILQTNTVYNSPNLLVGNGNNDDAAVYDMGDGNALISTTDFFMPIVDDAFAFGQIASANAISDVYAMGGKPLMAIAILGWPLQKLSTAIAQQVLEGARQICAEAGIPLAGGHSIESEEPIFGLSVNGIVKKINLKQNNTAKIGDVLLLTKPIGVGILSTAQKRGVISIVDEQTMMQQLTTLNKIGEALAQINGVHAMTDVSGFGLLGHVIEMCEGSGCSANIFYNQVPKIECALPYLAQRIVPDATYRNWNSYNAKTGFGAGVNVMEAFNLLPDPQTNGGLLISIDEKCLPEVLAKFAEYKIEHTNTIGKMVTMQEKTVMVEMG